MCCYTFVFTSITKNAILRNNKPKYNHYSVIDISSIKKQQDTHNMRIGIYCDFWLIMASKRQRKGQKTKNIIVLDFSFRLSNR